MPEMLLTWGSFAMPARSWTARSLTSVSYTHLFGASDATLPYALSYSRIYIAGSVFVLVVLGMNPFITTQGFAKTLSLIHIYGGHVNESPMKTVSMTAL